MVKPTRLALLKEIAEYLNEETEIYTMMHGALRLLVEGSAFTTGWIFFINEDGQQEMAADYHLPPSLLKNECQGMNEGTCWCVQAYHSEKLMKASNIIHCSRISAANQAYLDESEGITHHATVPLRSGSERFGLLNVASPYTEKYSEEDLELLESVAFQIGSTIKRIELTNKEKEAARLNERNRLARDLHDSVNQMLFSLKLTAHAAYGMTKEPVAKKAFETIETTSQQAVNEMRALIWQLKPIGLEHGLVSALKQYCKLIGIQPDIEVEGLIDLSSTVEEHIYRILQETMNNVKKHSQTSQAYILLHQKDKEFEVVISDHGVGFNPEWVNQTSHGIHNMRQRIKQIQGSIDINSKLNQGTTIRLNVPLTSAKKEINHEPSSFDR
ncbi:GAF domain-containing sensor histidine kinase [Staphylococcus sp. IVB6181]|uniref:GAF domain-containing sensor histidine kinase n=1 Tax=Staphylococcus sp. IVB6181 TaxID=2929481 RepID=UPI0021D26BD0|nr:GAF domain-containing sensor histidine kinase [Staphylococcus sp. IVB6181]UXV35998.1 GAF domain-containing sensor histidine kinase [Staphylococcus sp. IVB6181]